MRIGTTDPASPRPPASTAERLAEEQEAPAVGVRRQEGSERGRHRAVEPVHGFLPPRLSQRRLPRRVAGRLDGDGVEGAEGDLAKDSVPGPLMALEREAL